MDWFARTFVQASLIWLALGVTLGSAMAIHPAWTIYRPVHMHMTLLGFVTMMIFGVAYHVLPRFVGRPLWSKRLAGVHMWVSNLGLVIMCVGFALRVQTAVEPTMATSVLGVGGVLSACGAYLFAFNLLRSIGTRAEREARLVAMTERVSAAKAQRSVTRASAERV
jgi:cbb3-type cytochrome oxidase subunit 1